MSHSTNRLQVRSSQNKSQHVCLPEQIHQRSRPQNTKRDFQKHYFTWPTAATVDVKMLASTIRLQTFMVALQRGNALKIKVQTEVCQRQKRTSKIILFEQINLSLSYLDAIRECTFGVNQMQKRTSSLLRSMEVEEWLSGWHFAAERLNQLTQEHL